jgi:prepilin peptidase CpaA
MTSTFLMYLLLAFVAAVAVVDLARKRIPNALTVPAAGLAISFHAASAGLIDGLLVAVAGLLLGLAMFLPLYIAGGFGAGDVKAMAAVGAFLGPVGAILAGACILAVGAVIGLGKLAVNSGLRPLLAYFFPVPADAREVARRTPGQAADAADDALRRRFPYGLAIAIGTLLAVWGLDALDRIPGGSML